MKIVVAPDKFKGSLTSFEACDAIAAGIRTVWPGAEVACFPMADGGDGFATVLKHCLHTETISCDTCDPLGRPLTASYEWDSAGATAIIEVAAASGLVLLKETERNTLLTSSRGTGQLIRHAIEKGAGRIILGLGGSATTDAGTGILSALGFSFMDEQGQPLAPNGGNLSKMRQILTSPDPIPSVVFEIAVDVQNVLFGPDGAAFVYAPQKGAGANAIRELDAGLRNFSAVMTAMTGKDVSALPGTGAAGGIAAGLLGFFTVEMKKGVDMVIEAYSLVKKIGEADVLITGEGKIDGQSGAGKVVGRMAAEAKVAGIPCMALCGLLEADKKALEELGLAYAVSIGDGTVSLEEAMLHAFSLLEKKTADTVRKLPFFRID